jgi:DNA polymerase-3 subunit delta
VKELKDLRPVYLIFGEEDVLLERAVKRLTDRMHAHGDTDFDLDVLEAPRADAEQVLASANMLPVLSDKRIVVLRDADRLGKDDAAAIADYCVSPSESTALVLVAEKLDKRSRLFKAVDALGGVYEFKPLKRSEYPREVSDMFSDRGKAADRAAAQALVDAVGRDLRRLESEVEKISLHAGGAQRVTVEDVREVVSETVPTSIFDLLDALGERDCDESLHLLARLLSEGESLHGVHAMAVRHVRSLLGASALERRGTPKREMMSALGRPEWLVRKLVQQARGFSEDELVAALIGAAGLEGKMKTSRGEPRLEFERWVVGLCGR